MLTLFGQKLDAEKLTDTEVNLVVDKFKDIKPTDWFAKYVAYSVKNNISVGCSSDTWIPNGQMKGNQLAKMILNGLGYTSSQEYQYEKSLILLQQVKGFHTYDIVNYSELGNNSINRDNAVAVLYGTLTATMNNMNESVVRYLVDKNVLEESDFVTTVLPSKGK